MPARKEFFSASRITAESSRTGRIARNHESGQKSVARCQSRYRQLSHGGPLCRPGRVRALRHQRSGQSRNERARTACGRSGLRATDHDVARCQLPGFVALDTKDARTRGRRCPVTSISSRRSAPEEHGVVEETFSAARAQPRPTVLPGPSDRR